MDKKQAILIELDSSFLPADVLPALARIIAPAASLSGKNTGEKWQELISLGVTQDHIKTLSQELLSQIPSSFLRNQSFFSQYTGQVILISEQPQSLLMPLLQEISAQNATLLSASLQFDEAGKVIAKESRDGSFWDEFEAEGEMLMFGGTKLHELQQKKLPEASLFTPEHIDIAGAEMLIDWEDFLYVNRLPRNISYPKSRIKVLLLESIHPDAAEAFRKEGYRVETRSGAMSEDELIEAIKGVSVLGIRSKTHITPKVLKAANRLLVVGAFCIGTNQIDLEACLENGVVVFNAPYSNTRSVVELAIAEIIMLMRRIPYMSVGAQQAEWRKSSQNSYEIRGKKLGIVGYGNIGAQLSVLAEALGMDVYYYDVIEKLALGNATKCNDLHEMLSMVDVVTLHVDGRDENKMIFGRDEFEAMKAGAVFLNLSRGFVVDLDVLKEKLESGHIQGAGVDVYPVEPKAKGQAFESVLIGQENVILTPHIGGSTEEAQQDIGSYVPSQIVTHVNTGSTFGSVNFPNIKLPAFKEVHRLIHIHRNQPGILAQINQVFAQHEINIEGQYLKTNEQVGYVITDINREYNAEVLEDLQAIDGTVKIRVLY